MLAIHGADLFSKDLKEKKYLLSDIMDTTFAKPARFESVCSFLQYPFTRRGD